MLIINVDDDCDDREFFNEAVKALDPDMPCVLFKDGVELLRYLDENETFPDYIFIDINMPKMNGYECAREIKSNHVSQETQIVMYSTAFNPVDLEKFHNEGYKYVLKQNSMTDLITSLKTVISFPTAPEE